MSINARLLIIIELFLLKFDFRAIALVYLEYSETPLCDQLPERPSFMKKKIISTGLILILTPFRDHPSRAFSISLGKNKQISFFFLVAWRKFY